jgi:PadR family transcriptional regulator, regulatory protein PadR
VAPTDIVSGKDLRSSRSSTPLPFLSWLDKIRSMATPFRVTGPLLDVAEALLEAFADNREIHGWAMAKRTNHSGPTIYNVVNRLEDLDWITGRWEDQNDGLNRPRRRLYRLTPTGVAAARALLAERRPATCHPSIRPATRFTLVRALRAWLPGGAW